MGSNPAGGISGSQPEIPIPFIARTRKRSRWRCFPYPSHQQPFDYARNTKRQSRGRNRAGFQGIRSTNKERLEERLQRDHTPHTVVSAQTVDTDIRSGPCVIEIFLQSRKIRVSPKSHSPGNIPTCTKIKKFSDSDFGALSTFSTHRPDPPKVKKGFSRQPENLTPITPTTTTAHGRLSKLSTVHRPDEKQSR